MEAVPRFDLNSSLAYLSGANKSRLSRQLIVNRASQAPTEDVIAYLHQFVQALIYEDETVMSGKRGKFWLKPKYITKFVMFSFHTVLFW